MGAVLIILGFVFVGNSNAAKYTSLAVESLVLGLLFWILDDTLHAVADMRIDEVRYEEAKREVAKNWLLAIFGVRWVGLVIWIFIIAISI